MCLCVCVAGIVWWCPTLPRARQRSSCGRGTWCLSIRRGRTVGTKAPCRGRDRPACFPAASSRASELEKSGQKNAHCSCFWVTKHSNTHTDTHTQGWTDIGLDKQKETCFKKLLSLIKMVTLHIRGDVLTNDYQLISVHIRLWLIKSQYATNMHAKKQLVNGCYYKVLPKL